MDRLEGQLMEALHKAASPTIMLRHGHPQELCRMAPRPLMLPVQAKSGAVFVSD
jgi:hypothetical protein